MSEAVYDDGKTKITQNQLCLPDQTFATSSLSGVKMYKGGDFRATVGLIFLALSCFIFYSGFTSTDNTYSGPEGMVSLLVVAGIPLLLSLAFYRWANRAWRVDAFLADGAKISIGIGMKKADATILKKALEGVL